MWSYVAALSHFASEWLLFRSADLSDFGLLGPLLIARMFSITVSLVIYNQRCSDVTPLDDKSIRLLRSKVNLDR